MNEFSSGPICYIYNNREKKPATGWMCSPNGYIMAPAHLFIKNKERINHLDNINKADCYDIYYKQQKYSAALLFAYKEDSEWMDWALLKILDSDFYFEYYHVTLKCEQKASIHTAGYGDVTDPNVLDPADGYYVSRILSKDHKGIYLLKFNCGDAVQRGFSGAPIYDDSSDAVVGMQIRVASMALDERNNRAANKNSIYAVPMELILQRFPFLIKIIVLEGTGYSGCIIPKKLVTHISKGECILFVGAGCSIDAGLPSWPQLVNNLLQYTFYSFSIENEEKKELDDLFKKGKYQIIVQHCRRKLGKIEFGRFLNEQLSNYNPDKAVVYKTLSAIKFKAILTTNFDSLIETIYKGATSYTVDNFEKAFSDKTFTPVFKIHGSINDPDSIILTSTDHRKMLFGNKSNINSLQELFKNSTVLFIGYSFKDPTITMLLQELLTNHPNETRLHYAIIPNIKGIEKTYYHDVMNISAISFTTKWNTFEPLHALLNDLVASLPPKALIP